MATTIDRHSRLSAANRSVAQKTCIYLGIFLLVAGFGGVITPGLLGMHLSLLHNVVHITAGGLALWSGLSDVSGKARIFSISFGSLFLFLGIAGFMFGKVGYPGVGNMEADSNLLRIIPNALELGTSDHVVHLLLGTVFMVSAYLSKRENHP